MFIEKNFPVPQGNIKNGEYSQLFILMKQMDVGDSVLVGRSLPGIYIMAKRIGIKIKCLKTEDEKYRIWRVL